jgi:protein TonB
MQKTMKIIIFLFMAADLVFSAESGTKNKKIDECSGAVRISKEIIQPEIISKTEPSFPKQSLKKVRRGTPIMVEAIITQTGTIACTKIIRSEHDDLNASVLEAIKKWKYKPAMKDGKPVAIYFVITVHIDVR